MLVDRAVRGIARGDDRQGRRPEGIGPGVDLRGLRANDLIWPYVVNSYLKGKAPPAFDLLYWNSDATNLPGPMYCWYLRNTYLENKLAQARRDDECGVPVEPQARSIPRPSCSPRARTTSFRGQTAYESATRPRRQDHLRARRQRPHRRRDQPAGKEEAQLLDRRRQPTSSPNRGSMVRPASPAAGGRPGPNGLRQYGGPQVAPPEAEPSEGPADRAGTWALCEGEGRLNGRGGCGGQSIASGFFVKGR